MLVAAVLTSGAFSAPARADNVKSALKDFGLVGTRSPDCSKALSGARAARRAFAAPDEAKASAAAEDNNGEATATTIVDSDKIGVDLHP